MSVNAVMSQLEREPDEVIVDPWVVERKTRVAVEKQAIVAGALLHRFGRGKEVSNSHAGSGSIHWLVAWPKSTEAADALMAACLETMDEWGVAA